MSSSTFSLTSADGTQIAAYRWDPVGEPRAAVQLTHVCDPDNPHVELATPDRILSWYYPTAFPPAPADIVAVLCTTARRP